MNPRKGVRSRSSACSNGIGKGNAEYVMADDIPGKEELPEQYGRAGFYRAYLYRCYQKGGEILQRLEVICREKASDKILIFVSSSREYVFEAYDVEAFQYLLMIFIQCL